MLFGLLPGSEPLPRPRLPLLLDPHRHGRLEFEYDCCRYYGMLFALLPGSEPLPRPRLPLLLDPHRHGRL